MKYLLLYFVVAIQSIAVTAQDAVVPAGDVRQVTVQGNQLNIATTNAYVRIQVYSPSIIRVRMANRPLGDDFSYAVIADPAGTLLPEPVQTDSEIRLQTDSLRLVIGKKPFGIRFYTPDGRLINGDEPGLGTSWIGTEVTTYKHMEEGERFIGLGEKTGNLDRRGSAYTHWNSDVYGYTIAQDPLYSTIPFYIGIHHRLQYGIFFDNSFQSDFNFGASNDRFSSFGAKGGEMNYYFIYRSTVAGIITSYTALTGRMHMPPLWSLGYQQNRYSYYPDTEVFRIAHTLREKQIPADGITLDIHYMDAYKLFTWNKDRFPDPKGMIDSLGKMGFRLTVIVDPGIKKEKGYAAYESGMKDNIFLKYADGQPYTGEVWPGWCHFPDFTSEKGRAWWREEVTNYTKMGVAGIWNDMNEISTWGQKMPGNVLFDYDGHPTTHLKGHNVFGLEMARSSYEGARAAMQQEARGFAGMGGVSGPHETGGMRRPFEATGGPRETGGAHAVGGMRGSDDSEVMTGGPRVTGGTSGRAAMADGGVGEAVFGGASEVAGLERPFILSRSGYAGLQRYSALWTGDNRAEDDHMLAGVRLLSSLGLSGLPFTGMDVGGFTGNPSAGLYARWMQLGAFIPYFRNHTANNTKSAEPWSFGEDALDIARNYINLRYRLLPYLYSTFHEATQDGLPVLRSLAIDYTYDPAIYRTDFQNEFLFGSALLVMPQVSGVAISKVYLPDGEWYDLYTDAREKGGAEKLLELSPATLPVYVKAGSIIPMQSLVQHTDEQPTDTLVLHIYKGPANRFDYYEDDGVSYRYEQGVYYQRTIRLEPATRTITLDRPTGSAVSRFHTIRLALHGFDGEAVRVSIGGKGGVRGSAREEAIGGAKSEEGESAKGFLKGRVRDDAKGAVIATTKFRTSFLHVDPQADPATACDVQSVVLDNSPETIVVGY